MVDLNDGEDFHQDIEALYFGYRAFTALPDRILAEHGLGRAHHRILYFVRRQPGISIGDLLALLNVSKQAIHRPLKDLETRGLLVVVPDTEDRRVRRLSVSAAGAQLEAELTGTQARLLDAVFAQFDAATATQWRAVMTRLADVDREGPAPT